MLTDEDGDMAHEFFVVQNDELVPITPHPHTATTPHCRKPDVVRYVAEIIYVRIVLS